MADSDRKARSAEEYLGMREELLKEKASLQEQMQDMQDLQDLEDMIDDLKNPDENDCDCGEG